MWAHEDDGDEDCFEGLDDDASDKLLLALMSLPFDAM